jgi:hypothetical protein
MFPAREDDGLTFRFPAPSGERLPRDAELRRGPLVADLVYTNKRPFSDGFRNVAHCRPDLGTDVGKTDRIDAQSTHDGLLKAC